MINLKRNGKHVVEYFFNDLLKITLLKKITFDCLITNNGEMERKKEIADIKFTINP